MPACFFRAHMYMKVPEQMIYYFSSRNFSNPKMVLTSIDNNIMKSVNNYATV